MTIHFYTTISNSETLFNYVSYINVSMCGIVRPIIFFYLFITQESRVGYHFVFFFIANKLVLSISFSTTVVSTDVLDTMVVASVFQFHMCSCFEFGVVCVG